jgi:ferritin
MLSEKIQTALNEQIKVEASSSQFYLAMAVWAEVNGLSGVAKFLYAHSDEERQHMLKLITYINERGGRAVVPQLEKPPENFKSVYEIFQSLFDHEVKVTAEINSVVGLCLDEKDYTTHNFMQWYVAEQIEEEALAADLLDKLKLIGEDKGGMFLFDRELQSMRETE